MTYFTGIDVSLRSVSICIIDEHGNVCHEAKTAAQPAAIADCLNVEALDHVHRGLGLAGVQHGKAVKQRSRCLPRASAETCGTAPSGKNRLQLSKSANAGAAASAIAAKKLLEGSGCSSKVWQ